MKPKKFAMGGMPVGRAGPNRMMSPSMTPAGGAGLSQLIRGLGGGRQATPEEIAKMNSTMSSLGMSRPQFNPADADKLRAQMQSRLAAQGMPPPVARPVMAQQESPMGLKKGGSAKAYAKGGMIDGIAQRGKTKCKIC